MLIVALLIKAAFVQLRNAQTAFHLETAANFSWKFLNTKKIISEVKLSQHSVATGFDVN